MFANNNEATFLLSQHCETPENERDEIWHLTLECLLPDATLLIHRDVIESSPYTYLLIYDMKSGETLVRDQSALREISFAEVVNIALEDGFGVLLNFDERTSTPGRLFRGGDIECFYMCGVFTLGDAGEAGGSIVRLPAGTKISVGPIDEALSPMTQSTLADELSAIGYPEPAAAYVIFNAGGRKVAGIVLDLSFNDFESREAVFEITEMLSWFIPSGRSLLVIDDFPHLNGNLEPLRRNPRSRARAA